MSYNAETAMMLLISISLLLSLPDEEDVEKECISWRAAGSVSCKEYFP